jgi:ATP-dependent DNA ligase
MDAKSVAELPSGAGWLYEPKWDGFRCLVFRDGDEVLLQSKAGQPLGRYFPEMVEAFRALPVLRFVLDGEITIITEGRLSFDDLLLRIHPAASRIRRLSQEIPSTYMAFDLLVDEKGKSLVNEPLERRREQLEKFFAALASSGHASSGARVKLSPASRDPSEADRWMQHLASSGLDGVVAKRLDASYASGERTAMVKVKKIRTADCIVGGFRFASKGAQIGSLLLGLYNEAGSLDHVGFTSSFSAEQRNQLKGIIEPLRGGPGFTGKAPGGPSRWSTERTGEWEPLKPKLVCEVRYDYFNSGRFRHGTKFLRWRPDKDPRQCTFEQVQPPRTAGRLSELEAA